MAKKSLDWSCNVCGKVKDLLKDRETGEMDVQKGEQKLNELEEKDKEMLKMINFKVIVICFFLNSEMASNL